MRAILFLVALCSAFSSFAAPRCDITSAIRYAEAGPVSLAYQSIGRDSDPALLLVMGLGGQLIHWPDDPEPYRFLAIAEMASGDSAAAVRALREAITRAPERADLWESLGEALMMQAQGEVTPGAARAYEEALARDPAAATARFHLARRQIEAGETEAGLAAWRALRSELPAEDPRRHVLSAAIAEVEAGPRPAPANMPDATAIQAMVDGLAARLAVEPDNPQGWVRLVRSYAVLGQAAARDAALSQARRRYADDPALLQQLTEAARTEPLR